MKKVASRGFHELLEQFLSDPERKADAARKLSDRTREVSRKAKVDGSRRKRAEWYGLKVRLVELGLSKFSEYFKVTSFEYDAHLGIVILCQLSDRTAVHLPLKSLTKRELVDLNVLEYRPTLNRIGRKRNFESARPAFS